MQKAVLTTEARNKLPESKFAYVDENGNGHFPINDAAHVRNALARLSQSPFGDKARPKVLAAARRFGIKVSGESEKNMDGYEFTFDIRKAEVSERNGQMIIRGVASTMSVDRQDEAMSKQAMDSMLKQIKSGKVPLHNEHGRNWNDRIGNVTNGEIDSAGNLIIEAQLNKKHPIAQFLYDSIKGGETLGLSVAGKVKGFTQTMRTDLGKVVRTLGDVVLREISVTKHPANLDTIGLTAKSFIYEITKSVPEEAWLASEKGHYMDPETPTEETVETGEPTTETPAVEEQAQDDTVAAVTTDESTEVDAETGASEETESAEKAMMKKMPAAERKALLEKMQATHTASMAGMQAAHESHMKSLMEGIGHPVGPGETQQDADESAQKSTLELDETVVMKAMTKAFGEILGEELSKRDGQVEKMQQLLKTNTEVLNGLMKMPLQRKGIAIATDTGRSITLNKEDATIVEKSEEKEVKPAGSLADALQNTPYAPVSPR